jgi:hypothetical protein
MRRRSVMRSDEALGAMLGWRGMARRPSPNVSLLLTNGPVGLARGAHLAAEPRVGQSPSGSSMDADHEVNPIEK